MTPEVASLYADILKVEKPDANTRLVHARISDESRDLDGQVADYGWLKAALPDWFQWGNVREMHQSNVVGKATDLTNLPDEKAFDGVLKIVDPLSIKKLDEGLYGGVSIGIKSPRVINERGQAISASQPGRIVGGKIVEVSLVDHPANENCKLVLAKSATGNRGTLTLLAEPEEIKRDFSSSERKQDAKSGKAMPDGSFPIENSEDLSNAIHLAGHAKDPGAAKAHIKRRAAALGLSDRIPDSWKVADSELSKGPDVPVLTGSEAVHNTAIAQAMGAIKQLMVQELAEDEDEDDCVQWLAGIRQSLRQWAGREMTESGADGDDNAGIGPAPALDYTAMGADGELFKATLDDFIDLAKEPDLAKRRVFYSREHRTAIEQALRNLTLVLQGDMQGGPGADPTDSDAPAVADAELMRDGDARERRPSSVAQAGPATESTRGSDGSATSVAPNGNALSNRGQQVSVTDIPTTSRATTVAQAGPLNSDRNPDAGGALPPTGPGATAQPAPAPQAITRGTEPDLVKGVAEPDHIKALAADAVKAIFPELVKEFREALKDELKEEFAAKSLEAEVDKLGGRARPNFGPHLGEGTRVIEKKFAANETVNSDEIPQEVLDKMVRYTELAKSEQVETAASAKAMLKRLTEKYFGAVVA